MLQTRLLLINTVVTRNLFSDISKGYVFFFTDSDLILSNTQNNFLQKATPRGAELGARFGVAMVGWGSAIEASSVVTGMSLFIHL